MEEKRLDAYLNLIYELLQCSKGQEPGILEVHKNLIDADLVETMKQVAATLAEQGDEDSATFLRKVAVTISAMIGKPSSAETYVELIQMLLQAVSSSHADPQVVYPFLEANLDKLDDKSENNRSDTRAVWEAYNEAIALLETQKQQVWESERFIAHSKVYQD